MRARPIRRSLAALLAVGLCLGVGVATRLPIADAGERSALASRFSFVVRDVNGDPAGARTVRVVPPALRHIAAWISAVGASGGLADLDGDGLANDACLVDPRDDSVTVLPVPGRRAAWATFQLLPSGPVYRPIGMAPTGCLPGDLNEDGWSDVLVYF